MSRRYSQSAPKHVRSNLDDSSRLPHPIIKNNDHSGSPTKNMWLVGRLIDSDMHGSPKLRRRPRSNSLGAPKQDSLTSQKLQTSEKDMRELVLWEKPTCACEVQLLLAQMQAGVLQPVQNRPPCCAYLMSFFRFLCCSVFYLLLAAADLIILSANLFFYGIEEFRKDDFTAKTAKAAKGWLEFLKDRYTTKSEQFKCADLPKDYGIKKWWNNLLDFIWPAENKFVPSAESIYNKSDS